MDRRVDRGVNIQNTLILIPGGILDPFRGLRQSANTVEVLH